MGNSKNFRYKENCKQTWKEHNGGQGTTKKTKKNETPKTTENIEKRSKGGGEGS